MSVPFMHAPGTTVISKILINNYYMHHNIRVPTILLTSHTPSTMLILPRATSVAQSHFLLQLVRMKSVLTSLKYLHLYAHRKLISAYLPLLQIFLAMGSILIVYILVSNFKFLGTFQSLLTSIQVYSIISSTSILISSPQML